LRQRLRWCGNGEGVNITVKMSLPLTYSNSIKIVIRDKPSGGDAVLDVARPSHQFGGDWVTNGEVVSGVIFGLI
jgi:hypothetical protein